MLDIPLIAVDHLEGHLYSCQLSHPDRQVYPCVGLVVSGDIRARVSECRGPLENVLLGGTIDDAAGEARLTRPQPPRALGYPGGPGLSVRRDGQSEGVRVPPFVPPRRTARLQLLGAEDRRPLCPQGPGRADGIRPAVAGGRRRPRRELPGSRGRHPRGQGPAGIAGDRPPPARDRRGRGGEWAVPRAGRGDGGRRRGRTVHPAHVALHRQRGDGRHRVAQARRGDVADLEIDVTPGLVRTGFGGASCRARPQWIGE